MKQSPIRKLRRDRARLVQELELALGTGDKAGASTIEQRIKQLDQDIAAMQAARGGAGRS